MRQNSKHLDQKNKETDGQIAAGCTDDKVNAVMNKIHVLIFTFIFIYIFRNFIHCIFRNLDQAWIYSIECDIQRQASPKCKKECSTQKKH